MRLQLIPESGTIKISTTATGPALSLVGAESIDPGVKVTVKSSGVDYNKPVTWENEGYGKFCWKIEPFGDRDYIYSLSKSSCTTRCSICGIGVLNGDC